MAHVHFEVHHEFDAPPRQVWDELVDWKGHEAWIPATTVTVGDGDPTAVGHEFVARTGVGPLALDDRMRVERCDWDEATSSGDCRVEKIGPVLEGHAGFTVEPSTSGARSGSGTSMNWVEDVTVPYAPQFTAPVLAFLGAQGFGFGMRKLAKLLSSR